MSITGTLKSAGYVPQKSTAGDKPILKGVYRCQMVEWKDMPDAKFGPQVAASFKVVETLAGMDSKSAFPEFKGYFKTDAEKINSKRDGLAKLLNGFFSVGQNIDSSSDEAFKESMDRQVGTTDVYIKGYEKKPRKQVGQEWVDDPDGELKQDFTFMTEKNAMKEAEKMKKKAGHPL